MCVRLLLNSSLKRNLPMVAHFIQSETVVFRCHFVASIRFVTNLWYAIVIFFYFSKTKEFDLAPRFFRIDLISSTNESGPQI
jgi:hypothetical protein